MDDCLIALSHFLMKGGLLRTLLQELKMYIYDEVDYTPQQDALIFKNIEYNTDEINFGVKKFAAGDTTSYLDISEVNFLFIVSEDMFDITINDSFSLATKQFSYYNIDESVNVRVQNYDQNTDESIEIKYLHGTYLE